MDVISLIMQSNSLDEIRTKFTLHEFRIYPHELKIVRHV